MADIEDSVPYRERAGSLQIKGTKITRQQPTKAWPVSTPGTQAVFIKTFGCAHNQSDSEYMAGQLSEYGYKLTTDPHAADLWLVNSCTVKSPSQSAMETLIRKGRDLSKALVIAGCVSQANSDHPSLKGVSIVGVQQIHRILEVVEETFRGNEVRLLKRGNLPALDLPKVRKNRYIEIIPISVGCLGACTYCKTKHARGHLGSYAVSVIVDRVKLVQSQGVKEIWLSSEDTGAYGLDIGTDLPTLLYTLAEELEKEARTMLRIGMTNPPYILQHLEAMSEILRHPCVYSYLHIPVQSGSDAVLHAMQREYTVQEFKTVVDTLLERVPGLQIATDIICGFPGETASDFEKTLDLVRQYKFSQVHISQFYPRPGTPASRMKRVPTNEVKRRSRELTLLVEAFSPLAGLEGRTEKVWVTDHAADGSHLVGHTKSYVQVLLPEIQGLLGSSCETKIVSVGRWSACGEIVAHCPRTTCSGPYVGKEYPGFKYLLRKSNTSHSCATAKDIGTIGIDHLHEALPVVGDGEIMHRTHVGGNEPPSKQGDQLNTTFRRMRAWMDTPACSVQAIVQAILVHPRAVLVVCLLSGMVGLLHSMAQHS